jgi:hypothetical protein
MIKTRFMEASSAVSPLYPDIFPARKPRKTRKLWKKMEVVKEVKSLPAGMEDEVRRLNELAAKPPFCYIYKARDFSLL